MFFCEFGEIFKSNFFTEHLQRTASVTKMQPLLSGLVNLVSLFKSKLLHHYKKRSSFLEEQIVFTEVIKRFFEKLIFFKFVQYLKNYI